MSYNNLREGYMRRFIRGITSVLLASLLVTMSSCISSDDGLDSVPSLTTADPDNPDTPQMQYSPTAYSEVYEPNTSVALPPTVAWKAGPGINGIGSKEVRPQVVFVGIDQDLKVYSRSGVLIEDNIEDFVAETSSGIIPAFYVRLPGAAAPLKKWLSDTNFRDCFVCSTPENRDAVQDVADLTHVRGMLDYTYLKDLNRSDMLEMIASTNYAHGKVILISQEAATEDNIRFLQSLGSTVWAESTSDTASLVTLYTRGVNGVVTDDYEAAYRCEEFFMDDAPTLLRIPFIIGHRGDPSTYVENTLDSALGAYSEGADMVENDIRLTSDGKLIVVHDAHPSRFLGLDPDTRIEDYTADELRSHTFIWDDKPNGIIQNNEVRPSRSRYGKLTGQDENRPYILPLLSEYISTFRNKDLVHVTEIKTGGSDIIDAYTTLIDEQGCRDQMITITFNKKTLTKMYDKYPEMSVGALGFANNLDDKDYRAYYGDLKTIQEKFGTEAAVAQLYEILDRWNATMNPYYRSGYDIDIVRAASRRGLTVWPWTYAEPQSFAGDYKAGYAGLTMDYPWWTSGFITRILPTDTGYASGITQDGRKVALPGAERINLETLEDGSRLVMWRYKAEMIIDGGSYGYYYLYSEPFATF